jgi:hypothetical protein
MTRTVYACVAHAITLAAAALVHASNCAAPHADCDCTPEPAVPPPAPEPAPARTLPDTWITG